MAIVGPGAVTQDEIKPDPRLQGIGADSIVTIFNPLSDDFAIQVGVSKPVEVPIQVKDPATQGSTTLSESEITRTYGVGLRNADHTSRKHFTNQAIIRAGKSMRFTGDVAQVAVRQIVNEVMQREGNTKFISDPVRRKAVEDRIILEVQSQAEFMNHGITPVDQQVQEALQKANEETTNEEAFPGFSEAGSETQAPTDGTATTGKDAGKSKASSK